MTICVFLGPSLELDAARQVLDADYLPPARMGDVFRVAQRKPRAIAIIDGRFENTPAVWHKEILFALAQGIPVYGAASLGALRAAELEAFGMVGVGKIFEQYASGALEDDDEVAVVHAPGEDGSAMFSEAMINLRYALAQAAAQCIITRSSCDRLIAGAKALYYPERSWPALYRLAEQMDLPSAELRDLRAFVMQVQPNQKRDDALALLHLLAQTNPTQSIAEAPARNWIFEHTVYWDTVATYYHTGRDARTDNVSFERLRNHVLLAGPEREQLRQRALLLALVEAEAQRLRLDVGDMRAALARFRYQRGLQGAAAFRSWMDAQQINQQDCLTLARLEMLVQMMQERYADKTDAYLDQALKLRGEYPDALARVKHKWGLIAALGIEHFTLDDVASLTDVMDWYQREYGVVGIPLENHAAELGFASKRLFLNELFAEHLARHAPPAASVQATSPTLSEASF